MTVLSADWVLPVSGPPIPNGAVAIEDGRILAVGPAADLGQGRRLADAAIIPGLVNAHSHLEYAVYAGFGDGLADFAEWAGIHIERKQRLDVADVVHIARLGAAECLASGITTVGDCSFSGATAVACADLGLRAIVYLEVFGADPDVALERYRRVYEVAEPGLSDAVWPGVSPHSPYTVSAKVYAACGSLGVPIATHISESLSELQYLASGEGPWESFRELLIEPAGTTGTRMLASLGLLGPNLSAAHCVHVDEEEVALLATHRVGVVHCPRSNALLGCGIAPLRELVDRGVNVGIGTDSPASAPSFEMFEEMRTAVYMARARERRPDALTPTEALQLATLGSASALGLVDELGSLDPGKQADLAVVSLEGSPYLPWEDPAAAVVMGGSASRVLLTVVGGEVRYDAETYSWQELRQRGIEARAKLLGR